MLVTGRTRVAGVIGDPVRHSRSPALHNAAFAAAGLDWVYVAFEVGEGEVPSALAGMRSLGLAGLNVTMPHKQAVADAVDVLTPDAQALDAVNTVVPVEGRLVGHNTDGAGFLDSLVLDAGVEVAGRRCLVLGAGGAARAVVRALAGAGAAEVVVVNRTPAAGERAAALAGSIGRLGTELDVGDADLVVNATPLGMGARAGELPCDPGRLRGAGQVVVDLVYDPLETAWLAAARTAGATTVDGLGMLVRQAAHAFTLWTGIEAPVEAMRAGASPRP